MMFGLHQIIIEVGEGHTTLCLINALWKGMPHPDYDAMKGGGDPGSQYPRVDK